MTSKSRAPIFRHRFISSWARRLSTVGISAANTMVRSVRMAIIYCPLLTLPSFYKMELINLLQRSGKVGDDLRGHVTTDSQILRSHVQHRHWAGLHNTE